MSKPVMMWRLGVMTSADVYLPACIVELSGGFIEWNLGYFRTRRRALEFFRVFKQAHCDWLSMNDAELVRVEV